MGFAKGSTHPTYYARVLFYFAREAAGALSARHSLRPLFSRARDERKPRAYRAARSRIHILGEVRELNAKLTPVIARSPCDEAIHSFFARRDGLLRGACHRAALCADPLARNDGGMTCPP